MVKFDDWYHILLNDVDNTFNINMHTFGCFAHSEEEAIGKMVRTRPELNPKDIRKIRKL